MPLFSIITPCYNSSQTLWSTYESLLKQSHDSFEWILVDDASCDDGLTKSLIEKITNEAPFKVKHSFLKINYFGSKSVFTGCLIADGKYVAVLDHDDQLTPGALAIVKEYIDTSCNDELVAGVCGRCVNESGLLVGKKFDADCILANEGEIRFKWGITNELFQFSKIEIIKPFFELMKPGYTNGFVWSKISEKYKYIYVNDVLRVYDTALPSSYSNTKSMLVRYPEAKADALKATIFSYRPYLKFNISYGSQIIGSYLRHTINSNINLFEAWSGFDAVLKVWCLLIYPASIMKSKGWL
ncbi:glycosyltransferase family A protein [Rhodoferax sp. PAMC 29310]|uniref:glycosyltransferase family A protein n=1 Tax=Rhodoferax sp. PAMC 29310 TaxID=2822760 RepID=UPI001B323D09|nr:glycosyltransferase family A protein [Rhodoferax sp. PAMC 29310]